MSATTIQLPTEAEDRPDAPATRMPDPNRELTRQEARQQREEEQEDLDYFDGAAANECFE